MMLGLAECATRTTLEFGARNCGQAAVLVHVRGVVHRFRTAERGALGRSVTGVWQYEETTAASAPSTVAINRHEVADGVSSITSDGGEPEIRVQQTISERRHHLRVVLSEPRPGGTCACGFLTLNVQEEGAVCWSTAMSWKNCLAGSCNRMSMFIT
jgi:hypothetical protein